MTIKLYPFRLGLASGNDKAGREWVGTLDGMRLAEAGCQLAALVEGR